MKVNLLRLVLKCIFGLRHDWHGCKCRTCGMTRSHIREECYCTRCGKSFHLLDYERLGGNIPRCRVCGERMI